MKTTVAETRRLAAELLEQAGLSRRRAEATAHVLTVAEVWELGSHGLLRLPVYLDRIAAGGHPADVDLRTVTDTGPLLTVDGQGGLGHWQLADATSEAVSRARRFGIAGVAVADSGHCGALGVYAAEIAREGLAGLVLSCGPAVLPPWGGDERLLSTSPIAAGFPMPDGSAVVDLALTTVARGKIAAHARTDTLLPDGWALDAEGQPTNDPHRALTGMLAPLGGPKGFALAFMVEALTAGLVGPLLSADVPDFFDTRRQDEPQRIAHLVLALDPAKTSGTGDPADVTARLADLAVRTTDAGGRVPGSRRVQLRDIADTDEVTLDGDLWDELLARRERPDHH
ncbi:Ldh family oxidoreductase [Aeromicrobium sp. CTD01-1L150]|uniref:Ldh family oxidoreductase n=1 Tax=Aeromicrobium sp. CTD01-1L150 TaxID=3341830 RepID=UPI0035C01971